MFAQCLQKSQEPGELVTTTHRDYDLAEISKSVRGVLMGMGIVAFMHFYLGYTNPYVFTPLCISYTVSCCKV